MTQGGHRNGVAGEYAAITGGDWAQAKGKFSKVNGGHKGIVEKHGEFGTINGGVWDRVYRKGGTANGGAHAKAYGVYSAIDGGWNRDVHGYAEAGSDQIAWDVRWRDYWWHGRRRRRWR